MTQEASIVLKQSPIIVHTLEKVGAKVTERIDSLNIQNQVVTEETVKALKDMRATLNKEARDFETQRKAIKDAVLNPYSEFETTYKAEIIDKYKKADDLLKTKINEFELKIKQDKKTKLTEYLNEICAVEEIDFLTFDRLGLDINLSTTEKKYKEQINDFISKVKDDINLIMTETYSAEILVEYKKSLNASQSTLTVRQRKEAEKLEAERLKNMRTDKRVSQIKSLAFAYHDLTKTYNWIHDELVMIPYSQIESLSDEDWIVKFAELELRSKPKEEVKPEVLKAPIVEQPKQEPIQDKKEEVQTETFEAKFIVKGTYAELKALGEFLKANNYNYQNIK